MPYQHILWSVERDRHLSRAAAEHYVIMQALTERMPAAAPRRRSSFSWRRFLPRRTLAANQS